MPLFDREEYTHKDFALLARELSDLRMSLLLSKFEEKGASPLAETEYLKAMGFLELASRCMKSAALFQKADL